MRIEHRDSGFLALAWWPSPQDHDRHQALVEDDLVRAGAEVVVLDPSWTVPPAV